jgi:hypothetical protein
MHKTRQFRCSTREMQKSASNRLLQYLPSSPWPAHTNAREYDFGWIILTDCTFHLCFPVGAMCLVSCASAKDAHTPHNIARSVPTPALEFQLISCMFFLTMVSMWFHARQRCESLVSFDLDGDTSTYRVII